MLAALNKAADDSANDILLDFELTTATWNHQPKFEKLVQVGPDEIAVLVGTDDEIYGYVDKGTKPHIIAPKKPGGVLAFPSGYTAKTRPNVASSSNGGSGGDTVFAAYVLHPGTEARNFDKVIQKDWEKKFKRRMEQAMSEAASASGHEVK